MQAGAEDSPAFCRVQKQIELRAGEIVAGGGMAEFRPAFCAPVIDEAKKSEHKLAPCPRAQLLVLHYVPEAA